ncbi:hypothetical protein CTEN210_09187 [Chaetoceros tenuissimus]|uniref:DnaJ homolog subfamily C member 2 n=1 Tax=Chaetoceros tenuissimus TaxID=426638 RepID=A0AAD3H746_9STRA|nr:hypothetical protein CTEN210_09187 [Chaetoceros tenuissimus]
MTAQNIRIVPLAKLDFPDVVPRGRVQCGTEKYLAYRARRDSRIQFLHHSSFNEGSETSSLNDINDIVNSKKVKENKTVIDLNKLSNEELENLSFYDVLGGIKMHSTPEQIKRAFHKACLKYHPDKEGTNKESKDSSGDDPVFLKVKEAFETLSDAAKRKSYDSTVDFDESIPTASDISKESDFYKVFGDCFERNLRFAAENDPDQNKAKEARQRKMKRSKGKKDKNGSMNLPSIGDEKSSIKEVHEFYDYWASFQSWRDFTLKATKITEHDTNLASDRYEKRWMEKEIARQAKAMKKEEMARITKLVETSMQLDPRLKRERIRIENDKKEKARLKKEKIEQEEKERKEKQRQEEEKKARQEEIEREEKAKQKAQREQEKKKLRKAKQGLRKLALAEYDNDAAKDDPTWPSIDDMNDDVEEICHKMSALELEMLATEVSKSKNLSLIFDQANNLRDDIAKEKKAAERERAIKRAEAQKKEAAARAARAAAPWSKEELAALTKSVKKYPAGGANRWEAIALFVNNMCKLDDPRTKEECIEKYNQLASSLSVTKKSNETTSTSKDTKPATEWTGDQDKQLQAALAKYPSSMDKNERWSSIAKEVEGKTKKDCVARFKAIREALKKK